MYDDVFFDFFFVKKPEFTRNNLILMRNDNIGTSCGL